MNSPQLRFEITNQTIHRVDEFDVVGDSQNYLYAQFDFLTDEWDGLVKTALFRNGMDGTVYEMILENDQCLVPHEVLSGKEKFMYVSVFAGELITVNKERVYIESSGYWVDAESSEDPTPSVYQQIMDRLEDVENTVVESAESASASAETATQAAESASESATTALNNANVAVAKADIAIEKANSASESATSANASAVLSRDSANQAYRSSENANAFAIEAQSWARGGTNTRNGEDTDNAKYYAEQAREFINSFDWNNLSNTPTSLEGYGVSQVPTSMLVGEIGIDNIPKSALERMCVVADDTARFALTTNTVQNGDVVKVESSGLLYYVYDDTKLNSADGYKVFTAGSASSVPWSGVENKPTTLTGYGITDAVHAEQGKGLSSNDYTNAEKQKLSSVESNAEENVIEGIQRNGIDLTPDNNKKVNIGVPSNTSDLVNDSNYISDEYYTHTDNNYTTNEKNKLSGISNGAQVNTIESIKKNGTALTPDANKAVDIEVPTKTSDLTNDSNFVADASYVHTDNNYTSSEKTKLDGIESGAEANILEGVSVNGTALTPSNKVVDVTVPTKTSDLTNDSNFPEDSSYVHTDNNYTTTEKTKLSGIESGAEANVIESVKVGGTALTPDANKAVNISEIPASLISGTIDLVNLPQGALERLVTVADLTAMYALTTATVQNGDVVRTNDTGTMYYVVDDTHLDSLLGYKVFTAGTASSVPWTGVTDKPTTISGYGITNAYTKSEVDSAVEQADSNIATIETSPTTHAYAVGEYLVYNGILYKTKTAIASGDTLTVNTNIEATTVSEAMSSIQPELTFDSTPTQNSTNPVTSGGIYTALQNVDNTEEMTMAEYNLLTNDQKMDGTIRFITDV